MQRLLSLGGCSVCKGSSARGAGSAKGWAVNLLLVVVWLFLQCRESCQGGALVWRELGGAEEQGVFSPLPVCFHSSLSTAKSCQMEAMMGLCRSKNDASLPSGKLLFQQHFSSLLLKCCRARFCHNSNNPFPVESFIFIFFFNTLF